MAQKKCAVVTYENRDLPFKEEFRKNQKEYCLKHSYDYLCYDTYALSIPPYWLKPFIVRNVLHDYDYVMWVDSDTQFENMDIRMENTVVPGAVMSISQDKPQHRIPAKINTGVFIVTKDSLPLLDAWIALYDPSKWTKNGESWKCSGTWAGPAYEQGALITLLDTHVKTIIDIKPWHFMNNHPNSGHNGFVHHYCGAVGKRMLGIRVKK